MGAGVLSGHVVGLVEERLKRAQAPVNLRLWDGQLIPAPQPAPVTVTIKSPQALTQLASPSLGKLAKSYVEGEIVQRSTSELGASFLDKPFQPAQLLSRVQEAISSERTNNEAAPSGG